jgi:hypothetical protein
LRRENRKIRYENEIKKQANMPPPEGQQLKIYRLIKSIPQNLARLCIISRAGQLAYSRKFPSKTIEKITRFFLLFKIYNRNRNGVESSKSNIHKDTITILWHCHFNKTLISNKDCNAIYLM